MNKGILMISLGRLLMNIDLEEIFKNAFEIAKKCFFYNEERKLCQQ